MTFKERILTESYGYDHKSPTQRHMMNTVNALAGGTAGALGLGALRQHAGIEPNDDILDNFGTGAAVLGSAALGGHALGKLDKYLFTKMGTDDKKDFIKQ